MPNKSRVLLGYRTIAAPKKQRRYFILSKFKNSLRVMDRSGTIFARMYHGREKVLLLDEEIIIEVTMGQV